MILAKDRKTGDKIRGKTEGIETREKEIMEKTSMLLKTCNSFLRFAKLSMWLLNRTIKIKKKKQLTKLLQGVL